MTDGGAAFQPGQGEDPVPVRPRSAFVAHEVFGHGAGAVLVEPEVARDLRASAELARQERRIAGGLLYGRPWADDEGHYLVVDGFLESGPGENHADEVRPDGRDSFTLSAADLRLLREDAGRMYTAAIEVGWWRSLAGPGEFGPRDFESQRELVGPGGVGLLVFGSGLDWGTAYLGPDAQVPGSARSFIPVPRPATEPPLQVPGPALTPAANPTLELDAVPDDDAVLEGEVVPEGDVAPEPDIELEPVGAGAGATALVTRRPPVLTPAPQPSGPPVISPVRVPAREWGGAKAPNPGFVGPHTPTDVKIVVGLLAIVIVIAAVMVGVLTNSALVALILAIVGLLAGGAVIWASRA
jgi:hypothetical protein